MSVNLNNSVWEFIEFVIRRANTLTLKGIVPWVMLNGFIDLGQVQIQFKTDIFAVGFIFIDQYVPAICVGMQF